MIMLSNFFRRHINLPFTPLIFYISYNVLRPLYYIISYMQYRINKIQFVKFKYFFLKLNN